MAASERETIVLVFMVSPIIKYVRSENATIPVANPINLPGHNCPS